MRSWTGKLGLTLCLLASAGCARRQVDLPPPGAMASADREVLGAAIMGSMRNGIELHRVLDAPYRNLLEGNLAKFPPDPLGLSAQQIELLRSEGIRLAAVPPGDDDIRNLERALTQVPVVERVAMGTVPEWRAVVTSAPIEGSKFVRVGGDVIALADGRFRLLMRSYPLIDAPTPTLRLELIVQFHQPRRDPLARDPAAEERRGVYVPTTAISLDLDGTWALVLTAGSPEVNWGEDEEAVEAPEDQPQDRAAKPTTPRAGKAIADGKPLSDDVKANLLRRVPTPDAPAGPQAPRIRTAGEETLITADGSTRYVLIFVPRVE